MLVVRTTTKKEEGEAQITRKGQVPVKTEKGPDVNQQALYLIISLMDLECSRGFRHAEMVKREGGQLVLTDEANSISEDPSRIPTFIWDMKKIKAKAGDSGAISNLWKAFSEEKKKKISFKGPDAEQNAKIAYEILRAAGFEEDMLEFASKRSIRILGLPDKFDIEGLTVRLAKNLERIKKATEAKEAVEVAKAREGRQKEVEEWFGREFAVNDLARLDPKTAAEMLLYVYQQPMISGQMKDSVWFLLNKRKDSAEILAEFRKLYPINTFTGQEFKDLAYSLKTEEPLPGMPKITPAQKGKVYAGDAHRELREYEEQRRGGLSEIQKAAAMPWQIPKNFQNQLANGEKVLFYTFPSAEQYAEARATVEALFPGRQITLEHTPEFDRGRDMGEWVMSVQPKGANVDEGAAVAGTIRWKSEQADPSAKPSLQTNPFKRTIGGKTEYVSAAEAIADAVNNYGTYTTKFAISVSDPSSIPDWFMSLVMGKNMAEVKIKDPIRQALLEKGVSINVEVIGTSTKIDGGREVVSGYTYRVTISGENVRKPLEVARNEARSKATLPQLKRIAAFEDPSGEPTYAERVAALKKKVKPEA